MLRKLWCAESWLFLLLWPGLLWFGREQFLCDPGVFWNTVVGQRILTTGDVPRADEFSCTFAGASWISHQWLAQVGMAALHAISGLDALVLGTATLLAVLYAWAIGRLVRSGCHWLTTVVFLALLLMGSRYHWLARPQLFTIALLGWAFAQLVDFETGLASWRRLCWLPAVFVLWTNLHGGALGGLATVLFVFLGWSVAWLLGWRSPLHDAADLRRLFLVGAGCGLATLVNPYGWDLPLGWVRLMQLQVLSRYIYEHMPLDWNNPYQRGILVFGFVYVLVLATIPWRQWRVCWLVPVLWFVLTLERVRHCTLFSITAALALTDVLPHTRLFGYAREHGLAPSTGARNTSPWLAWLIPAAVVALAVSAQACAVPMPLLGAGHAQTDPGLVPTELLGPIRERSRPGAPIFNDMAYGGFLIYYAPELRPYLDDRCELYGDAFMTQYLELSVFYDRLRQQDKDPTAHAELDRWTDARGIRLALVVKGQGFDYYLRSVPERWTRVAEGRFSPRTLVGAVLYERRVTR